MAAHVPFLRIITVDFRSGPHLADLIKALSAQTDEDFEVIIVDNACPEGAARALDLPDARFRILTSDKNLGFSGGCNLGALGATAPWLAMLNPDVVPDTDLIANLRAATLRYPDAAIFGATLVDPDTPDHLDGFGDVLSIYGSAWHGGTGQSVDILPDADREVFSVCGAAAIYNRHLFERLNGFDETFFCYLEDIDLCWRAAIAGTQIIQLGQTRASHIRSVSTQDNPDFRVFHSARNVIWTYAKSAPLLKLPIILAATLATTSYLSLRGSYGPSRSARWRGVRAGLRGLPHALSRRTGSAKAKRRAASRLSTSVQDIRTHPIRSWPISKIDTQTTEN